MSLRTGIRTGFEKRRREEFVSARKFGLHLVEPMLHWSWLT